MRNLVLLLSIAVTLFAGSCRKELPFDENTPVDTLYPKPYLPIYPGSWWQYRNIADATFFTETAGGYVKASINYRDYHSQPYIVPTFHGIPYFGYGFHKEFSSLGTPFTSFTYELSETTGTSWVYESVYVDPRWNGGISMNRTTDSTGLVKTTDAGTFINVIKVLEMNYRPPYQKNYYYFAKDVGMIEMGTISSSGTMTPVQQLDSYFINN